MSVSKEMALIVSLRRWSTRLGDTKLVLQPITTYHFLPFNPWRSRKLNFLPIIEADFRLKNCKTVLWSDATEIFWLGKLILSDCFGLYEDDVNILREIVADVEWDEWEQEYESE